MINELNMGISCFALGVSICNLLWIYLQYRGLFDE